MELILLFPDLQWKNFSYKMFLTFTNESKTGFENTVRERSSITSARLGGVGGLSQNADTADALEGGGGV